jgi:hypothetical protein
MHARYVVYTLCAVLFAGCTVDTLEPILVDSITLDPVSTILEPGETLQLSVTVLPSDAADTTVSWQSADRTVATVSDDGLVTGIAAGRTTVLAMSSNPDVAVSCDVTVGATLSGTLTYNGAAHSSDDPFAVVGVRNLDTAEYHYSRDVRWSYDATTGAYQVHGLPEADLYMWLTFADPPDEWMFGGSCSAEHTVDLTALDAAGRAARDIPMEYIVHLTAPDDNGAADRSVDDSYPVFAVPPAFTWNAVPEADQYIVDIDLYRSPDHPSGYGYLSDEVYETVTTLSYTPTLTANATNEHYAFSVTAYTSTSEELGSYMHPYTDGYGWEYRFVIE